jgi:hypothetical protein
MSDAETLLPAPEAAPALAADAPEDLRPAIARQLQRLEELADLGLAAGRAVVRQAETETPPPAAEIALAYSRVSRAVRLTLMLQSKLMESKGEEAERRDLSTPEYQRKARVESIFARVADAQAEDQDTADAMIVEAGERLDDEDLYGDLMEHPLSEIVDRLCKDFDLDPDWPRLSQELWARREAESDEVGEPLIPLPLDGGEVGSGVTFQGRNRKRDAFLLRKRLNGRPQPCPSPIEGEEFASCKARPSSPNPAP